MHDMKYYFKEQMEIIVSSPELHAKWLNSLSLMENTGARKISHYEDPVHTDIIVLKHAAEEARHAYYLKKQINKLDINYPDYSFDYLLAPVESYQYLRKLDAAACRYLKEKVKLGGREMHKGAYLLVTYAIEVRADELYGVYQDALTAQKSKVNVKSIIAEEEGHLAEMTKMLETFHPEWQTMASDIRQVESALFRAWLAAIKKEVGAKAIAEIMGAYSK
jgi:bacterioferritin (cytochrome b1)